MKAGNIGTTKRGMEIKSPPTSWNNSTVSMYTPYTRGSRAHTSTVMINKKIVAAITTALSVEGTPFRKPKR